MSETYTLSASKRESTKQSAREARVINQVPCVVYGHGVEPQAINVGASELLRLYRRAGQSTLIELDVDGKKHSVLIHDMQIHPVRMEIRHVDFMAVNPKENTVVHVPVLTIGESPAVKNSGGILMVEHDSITIRCLPKDIPHDLTVDISKLKEIGDHVCVKALGLDLTKHEVMGLDEEAVVVSIAGFKAKEEDEAADAEDAASTGEGAEATAAE